MQEQSHPLNAIRRMGVVNSFAPGAAAAPPTVNVGIGGDTTAPVDLPYVKSYIPVVGDDVVVLSVGADHVVLGSSAAAAYYEEWNLSAQVIATATVTALTGMTLASAHSDYPTALNTSTGIWTAPAAGIYTFTLSVYFATWAIARMQLNIGSTAAPARLYGIVDQTTPAASGLQTLSFTKDIVAGDTLNFNVYQATGANRTVQTVAPNLSFLSINRK